MNKHLNTQCTRRLCLMVAISAFLPRWSLAVAPEKPPVLQVVSGIPGWPPRFIMPRAFMENADDTDWEFEVRRYAGTKATLFARVWINNGELWGSFFYDINQEELNTPFHAYMSGSGPGGLRLFPVGEYGVTWRGWNQHDGFGPPSDETRFTVPDLPALSTTLKDPQATFGPNDDLALSWSNNFTALTHKLKILQGRKSRRNTVVYGGYSWWHSGDRWHSTYKDRPNTPKKELSDGDDYKVLISSYSPVAKKWAPWIEHAFVINRGSPPVPNLQFSRQDYTGWREAIYQSEWTDLWGKNLQARSFQQFKYASPLFEKSPRPYFIASYSNQPSTALWSYFDIRQKSPNGSLKVVRKGWHSRYGQWGNENNTETKVGGFGYSWNNNNWQIDLPPGDYVWRVQAGNGPSTPAVWTAWVTNRIDWPEHLDVPDETSISLSVSSGRWGGLYVGWDCVPNAYLYEFELYRNGSSYKKITRWAKDSLRFSSSSDGVGASFWQNMRLPNGEYRVRMRAVNRSGNNVLYSEWSDLSEPVTL